MYLKNTTQKEKNSLGITQLMKKSSKNKIILKVQQKSVN